MYVYTVYLLIHTGKGERGRDGTKEKVREATVYKARSKNTSMTDCISSLKTLINTCRRVPLQVIYFR
jgi:hypothetical protein